MLHFIIKALKSKPWMKTARDTRKKQIPQKQVPSSEPPLLQNLSHKFISDPAATHHVRRPQQYL